MNVRIVVFSCAVVYCSAAAPLHAQAIAAFDENSVNRYAVGPYDAPGAITNTPDSILFDVVPVPPSSELTGATGRFYISAIDFAPGNYQWEMRFRILAGNNISAVGAVYSDRDVVSFTTIEETYLFNFDISSLTPASGWVTLRQGFNAPYLLLSPVDGVQNPGLGSISFVAANAIGNHFHLELDYLRIIPIPEPSAMMLLLVGVGAAATARFRVTPAGRAV